jgi:hypothetical protein
MNENKVELTVKCSSWQTADDLSGRLIKQKLSTKTEILTPAAKDSTTLIITVLEQDVEITKDAINKSKTTV